MRWCDRHRVDYVIGLAGNAVLERLAASWSEQARQRFDGSQDKQRLFGEVSYAAKTWDRARRVIVKAEHLPAGPNTRFVVTNRLDDRQVLYDTIYCQRGEMENRIKEQPLELFARRTSCHAFLANPFRFLLSAAAYTLLETLRRLGLADTDLAHAQAGTIRLKLLKVGARVRVSVRRILLHLPSVYPFASLFRLVVDRLSAWPVPTPVP
jgi:hypothetical protein